MTPVPTYGGDTVLNMPRRNAEDESEELGKLAEAFMDAQFEADAMPESQRVEFVIQRLKVLESAGLD